MEIALRERELRDDPNMDDALRTAKRIFNRQWVDEASRTVEDIAKALIEDRAPRELFNDSEEVREFKHGFMKLLRVLARTDPWFLDDELADRRALREKRAKRARVTEEIEEVFGALSA